MYSFLFNISFELPAKCVWIANELIIKLVLDIIWYWFWLQANVSIFCLTYSNVLVFICSEMRNDLNIKVVPQLHLLELGSHLKLSLKPTKYSFYFFFTHMTHDNNSPLIIQTCFECSNEIFYIFYTFWFQKISEYSINIQILFF